MQSYICKMCDLKNKIAGYFSSKCIYLGKVEKLKYGTSNLWQTISKSKETKEGQLLLGFKRTLGKVVLSTSSLEKNKNLRL